MDRSRQAQAAVTNGADPCALALFSTTILFRPCPRIHDFTVRVRDRDLCLFSPSRPPMHCQCQVTSVTVWKRSRLHGESENFRLFFLSFNTREARHSLCAQEALTTHHSPCDSGCLVVGCRTPNSKTGRSHKSSVNRRNRVAVIHLTTRDCICPFLASIPNLG